MTLEITPEAADSLNNNKGVVALESTLITHGFPHPENLAIARESEDAVRAGGAVPATIAVIDGILKAGLLDDELKTLATRKNVIKASSRDLPIAIARKMTAGTTVAATMRIAAEAGIKLFATGGLGGVHRGVADTWDISADLQELSKTNVTVVCSGAKSLLDLPKTLEVLEILGVPVIGYRTDEFPAFYSRSSGLKIDARADTPREMAAIIKAHENLKMPGGILIVNPVSEEHALGFDEMEKHIATALKQAEGEGITGKAATPYLLNAIVKATNGKTVEPNKGPRNFCNSSILSLIHI